eukprot:scaffold225_cov388-Prasinococcus_capsulatus_cf.AAC.44
MLSIQSSAKNVLRNRRHAHHPSLCNDGIHGLWSKSVIHRNNGCPVTIACKLCNSTLWLVLGKDSKETQSFIQSTYTNFQSGARKTMWGSALVTKNGAGVLTLKVHDWKKPEVLQAGAEVLRALIDC